MGRALSLVWAQVCRSAVRLKGGVRVAQQPPAGNSRDEEPTVAGTEPTDRRSSGHTNGFQHFAGRGTPPPDMAQRRVQPAGHRHKLPSQKRGFRIEAAQPAPHRRRRNPQPVSDRPVTPTITERQQRRADLLDPITATQQTHRRQQHVCHQASSALSPARFNGHLPAIDTDRAGPRRPPRAQHPPAPGTHQPARTQSRLDGNTIVPYSQQRWCSAPIVKGPLVLLGQEIDEGALARPGPGQPQPPPTPTTTPLRTTPSSPKLSQTQAPILSLGGAQQVPAELSESPKHGFGPPLDTWMRGELAYCAEAHVF